MYPDLEVARDFLHSKGIVTDVALTRYMLDNYQVAVLAGSAFGDDESCFRFRVATSLLYGATTEERLGALDWAATGKLELPTHIAQAIAQLQTMVKEIVHPV
jgi:hypothetical protein